MDKEEKMWAYKMSIFSGLIAGFFVTLLTKLLTTIESIENHFDFWVTAYVGMFIIIFVFILLFLKGKKQLIN